MDSPRGNERVRAITKYRYMITNLIKRWGSLNCRQLHKKLTLPAFRLDAPILFILTLRRIGASKRNAGKMSFLCSCLQRKTSSFYYYRSNWELSTFTRSISMHFFLNNNMQALNYRKYSTASDVWSFGVLVYEAWSLGHTPFANKTPEEVRSI